MSDTRFSRAEALFGTDGMKRLSGSHVAVFGIGGVGGYAVEALARSGIGALTLFDSDRVDVTNINRQIFALENTVGMYKCDVARERILNINPDCRVTCNRIFYLPENADEYPLDVYDYVVDAVDTVSAKIEIAVRAEKSGVPVISCMGTGNKTDPCALRVSDIYSTAVCPLARVMRRELRARGVKALKVVYSEQPPLSAGCKDNNSGRPSPASCSFVPAAAGLIIAGQVVCDIAGIQSE